MKAYHKSCGSSDIVVMQGRDRMVMSFCRHCKKHIETMEIIRPDRRINAITFKGRAFIYGRECK